MEKGGGWPPRRFWYWLSLSGSVLALDQLSKHWVAGNLPYLAREEVFGILEMVHWCNAGAAFGFLASAGGWQRWFLLVLAVAFSIYLVWEMLRVEWRDRLMGWAFALVLGGALGNMVDRAWAGCVTDFILFRYESYYFPAFNVADMSLTFGAALWLVCLVREIRDSRSSIDGE